jgi:hypothetical protein
MEMTVLAGGIEALREAFNRDGWHTRLPTLASPT